MMYPQRDPWDPWTLPIREVGAAHGVHTSPLLLGKDSLEPASAFLWNNVAFTKVIYVDSP